VYTAQAQYFTTSNTEEPLSNSSKLQREGGLLLSSSEDTPEVPPRSKEQIQIKEGPLQQHNEIPFNHQKLQSSKYKVISAHYHAVHLFTACTRYFNWKD